MARFEFEGPLEVFTQEGGFADCGIRVAGKDVGEALMAGAREGRTYRWGRVVVVTSGEGEEDTTPGFLKQVVRSNG